MKSFIHVLICFLFSAFINSLIDSRVVHQSMGGRFWVVVLVANANNRHVSWKMNRSEHYEFERRLINNYYNVYLRNRLTTHRLKPMALVLVGGLTWRFGRKTVIQVLRTILSNRTPWSKTLWVSFAKFRVDLERIIIDLELDLSFSLKMYLKTQFYSLMFDVGSILIWFFREMASI